MLPSHLFNSGALEEFFGTTAHQNEQGGWDTSQNIEALVGHAGPSYPSNSAAPGEPFGTTVHRNESGGCHTSQNIGASQNTGACHPLTWPEVVNRIHPLDLEALINMSPSFAAPAPAPAPMPFNLGIPAAAVRAVQTADPGGALTWAKVVDHINPLDLEVLNNMSPSFVASAPAPAPMPFNLGIPTAAVQTADPGHAPTWAEVVDNIYPLDLEAIINISPTFAAPAPMPSGLGIPAATVQPTIHPHTFMAPAPELFSSIRVDGVFEEDLKEYLQHHLPNARQLHIFMMDLCNVAWNTMFSQSSGRWPTSELCERIIDQTCRRRCSNNPRWELERGTIIPCFSQV